MIPILIQNILEEKDRNRDGFIDFEEFINGDGNKQNYIILIN